MAESEWRDRATQLATEAGLDPEFVARLIHRESAWDPAAIGRETKSGERAVGLMQLLPSTAKWLGVNPHDPMENLRGGIEYLKRLTKQFPGRQDLVAAAYNAGPGAVQKAGNAVPNFKETQDYVADVAGSPESPGSPGSPEVPTTGTLAQRIRKMAPGAYDDLSDAALEEKWLAKYPEDADIPRTKAETGPGKQPPPGEVPKPGRTNDAVYEAAKASGKPVPQGPTRGAPESFPRLRGFVRAMDEGLPAKALAGYGAGVVEGIPEFFRGLYGLATTNPMTSIQQFADTIRSAPENISKALEEEARNPGSPTGFMSGLGRQVGAGVVAPEVTGAVVGGAARAARRGITGMRPANPEVAAAVEAGQRAGIPVDAATATGNRAIAAAQHMADRTFGGSVAAKTAEEATSEALAKHGERLAQRASPTPTTPEGAGRAIRSDTMELEQTLNKQANEHYGRQRELEAEAEPTRVETAPPMDRAASAAAERTLGEVPSAEVRTELKRMAEELKAMPYQKGGLERYVDEHGFEQDRFNKSRPNAPVYHDIRAAGSSMTGEELAKSIDAALDSGYFNQGAKAAAQVAKHRIEGLGSVERPFLPPSAGAAEQAVRFPTDLAKVKSGIQEAYQQLKDANEVVGLTGDKKALLGTLHDIMTGPDVVPISVADRALGELKALARPDNKYGLRSAAQSRAVGAVRVMEAEVQRALKAAGPDMQEAMQAGRAATRAKYAVRDVIEGKEGIGGFPGENVDLYRRMVSPGDADIAFLRSVRETAPGSIERVGRAWLEESLPKGFGETTMEHAARRLNQWRALGPETKRILFGSELTPELDKYFLLQKKMAENANPSGTAHNIHMIRRIEAGGAALATFNPIAMLTLLGGEVGMAGLSYLMHNPTFVRMLNRGTQLGLGKASAGTQASAITRTLDFGRRLAKTGAGPAGVVGRASAVPVELPAAAEQREQSTAEVAR